MNSRGGPQRIPRPDVYELGKPPPWADCGARAVRLHDIKQALRQRGPGRAAGITPGPEHRRSAVLVAVYEDDGETWVVLTRRSALMRLHTHEVSFPGGRIDPGDADEWSAALREAHEEVALDPTIPRQIGELDSFVTGGSDSFVTPVVASLPGRPDLVANEAEVEHILHVPLRELLRPEIFREELWTRPGRPQFTVTFFELVGDTVWGATGAMLRQLLAIATDTDETLNR